MSSFVIPFLVYLSAIVVGFILGRITGDYKSVRVEKRDVDDQKINAKGSFFKPEKREKKIVKIDDSTFVTTVASDSLEKKGINLGTESSVEDNVSASVSKLAQLKKNR